MPKGASVLPVSTGGRNFYAVLDTDEVSAFAEVTASVWSEGDLVRPSTLQFIWTPPGARGNGHAKVLVTHLLGLYPDLSHDGHLSPDGEVLVRRYGIPLRAGATPSAYDPAAAEELGRYTYELVRAAVGDTRA